MVEGLAVPVGMRGVAGCCAFAVPLRWRLRHLTVEIVGFCPLREVLNKRAQTAMSKIDSAKSWPSHRGFPGISVVVEMLPFPVVEVDGPLVRLDRPQPCLLH